MNTRILLSIALLVSCCSVAQNTTALWGKNGEPWTPEGRLPDFSFAGYQRGEEEIPTPTVTNNVKDFGAVGDGITDDSDAFVQALAEVTEGVIFVPEGRYLINKMLSIDKPNLVLRGAGPDKTTLWFPNPLTDIKPNWGATTSGQRTSNYSWSGGFITIRGDYQSKLLSKVSQPAKRGAYSITVENITDLNVGQEIEILQIDTEDNTLAHHLYTGDPRISLEKLNGRVKASLITKITAIDGNTITFDRALRSDIEARWQPSLYRFAPTVTNSGIEGLRFEFPNQPYNGHFSELGYNAFTISRAAHCWVRNVRIHNPESGGFVSGHFNTVDGITFTSEREKDKNRASSGHHGITNGGNDNLLTNFDYQMEFIHDITVSRSAGNVHKNGRGVNLSLDHHRYAPHDNLFTNIDVGIGSRTWRSGGGRDLGAHCAGHGTFWNLRSSKPIPEPDPNFAPWSINLIGVNMTTPNQTEATKRWYEHNSESVEPLDLHAAQLKRRMLP